MIRFDADPRAPALTAGAECLTFGQLEARVDALARALARQRGIVAVRAANTAGPALVMLAALRAGRPLALLSPACTPAELGRLRALLGNAVEVDGTGRVVWEGPRDAPAAHHPETAVVVFTSGSTGEPRAVQLSRGQVALLMRNVTETLGLRGVREQVVFAPLSHVFGGLAQFVPGVLEGVHTRLLPGLAEARVELEQGRTQGVWGGVPAHWEALLRHTRPAPERHAGVTHVVSASAPLSPALRRRLAERFPAATVFNGYGQSEAPRMLCLSSRHPRFFGDATGVALPGAELCLRDGDELCVRGPLVMLGYLGAPGGPARGLDADGWLRTGDAARIDPDGVVTVLGRLDDVRKVGGERISLVEVDHALLGIEGVDDAACAVDDDEVYGAVLVAFLVGNGSLAGLRRDALRVELARDLSWHKVPRRFYRVDALPRNPMGKLQRGRLLPLPPGARELG